jgi:hypothetical protein
MRMTKEKIKIRKKAGMMKRSVKARARVTERQNVISDIVTPIID